MSQGVTIDTTSVPWAKTNPAANSTASSAPTPVPKTTVPSGDGVIPFGHGGGIASSGVLLEPYGVGADSTTFLMYVFGWRAIPAQSQSGTIDLLDLWTATLLASFTCTLDTALPGLANTPVPATNFFCSGIVLGTGNSGISVEVVSGGHANHWIAHVVISTKGFRFLEVLFNTGASATSMNALWAKM